MFGRVTTFAATDIAAIEDQLNDLGARSAAIPGQIRSEVVWADDGKGMVVALYEDEASAKAAEENALKIWASVLPYLSAAPETRAFPKAFIMK